jgi:methionyl-tRNA formyltransferase
MGTPPSVVPVLRRLHEMRDVSVVAAVAPPDRPRGRGRQPEPPPTKREAQHHGIPVLQPQSLRNEAAQAELAALNPDLIVVAAYGRLLPPPVLDLPPHGCLNLHPSLLPRHRGPSPVATSILENDVITGVSLMLLDEGMDTGPIIAQTEIRLKGDESAGELTDRLFDLGGELLERSLGPWVSGELKVQPQDAALATVTSKLERADGLADWNLPAETLARQCRAYDPWPGLYTHWNGKVLKLLDAVARPGLPTEFSQPGRVVSTPYDEATPLAVATGCGSLDVRSLQMEGRRAVSALEFVNGAPGINNAFFD